jgi:hypothetical protein
VPKHRIVPVTGDPLEWVDVPDIDEIVTPSNVGNLISRLPIKATDAASEKGMDNIFERFAGPTYTSFSGCDIIVQAYANGTLKKFAELQTISYSVHREKTPVRTLGRANPKGFARGTRTIAGSLIFTVFDRNTLWELLPSLNRNDPPDIPGQTPLTDQIPPIDITITFQNESGVMAAMRIYGMEIVDEGQTMSIDDIMTESIMSWMARDITLMSADGQEFGPEGKTFVNQGIFFADEVSRMNFEMAARIVKQIGVVQTQLLTADAQSRPALLSSLSNLNAGLEALSRNSYNIPKEGTLDKTGPYYTPWTYLDIR